MLDSLRPVMSPDSCPFLWAALNKILPLNGEKYFNSSKCTMECVGPEPQWWDFLIYFLTFTNKSKKTPNAVTVIWSGFVSRSASTEPLGACPGWCSRGFKSRLHENCSCSAAKDWKQGEHSWETWCMSYFLPEALMFGSCQGKILDNVALKLLYLTKSLQPSRYSIRQIKARG